MRALREVVLVVEFGRCFEGEVGFLEVPGWRRDLCWVAEVSLFFMFLDGSGERGLVGEVG